MFQPTFYYIIPKQTDGQGLTHGYRRSLSKKRDREEFDQFLMRGIINSDSYREGPPRLYEVPRFSASIFPLLIVSENVKAFFSHLKLPKHAYTLVELDHYKLYSETEFYSLQLKENTLLEYLDWEQTAFFYTLKSSPNSLEEKVLVQNPITSQEDILKERKRLKEELNVRLTYVHPTVFPQKEHFDIITYQYPNVLGKVIMVADYVRTAFEKYFPDQVDFIKVEKLDIRVNEEAYLERKSAIENLDFSPSKLEYEIDEEFLFYASKMERLIGQEVKLPLNNEQHHDEFTEKEKALKKIFPPEFKAFYKNNSSLQNFQLLEIKDFYIEGNYQSSLPQSYGAVIFAEDGSGEGIGLLLHPESDYELGDTWYYFSHEDGNIFSIVDRSEYIIS